MGKGVLHTPLRLTVDGSLLKLQVDNQLHTTSLEINISFS